MTSKKLGTLLRSVPPATAQAAEPPEPPATRPPEESWPPPRRKVGPANDLVLSFDKTVLAALSPLERCGGLKVYDLNTYGMIDEIVGNEWTISLELLKRKCGSGSSDKEFRRLVGTIIEEDARHRRASDGERNPRNMKPPLGAGRCPRQAGGSSEWRASDPARNASPSPALLAR